ncbi:MAG: M15 family metallopeptidase [Lachnospiraceae bacterium]|nr:M15 family metallopeptidase [Lachnospiraceae bacterium]
MSSSFATPDQANDNEIYLSNISADEVNIYDTDVSLDAGDFIDNDSADELSPDTLVDDEVIVSGDLFTFEEEKQLESTENIDKFTIDDLYADAILSDSTVSSDSSLSGFDKDAWYMILVNKTHPVPDDYEVKLTTLKGDMKCDERVLEPLKEMLNGAKADGIDLIVCSPYRDYQLQERLFLRKINAYMDLGMSYLESYKLAAQKVIMPGASEHQLGIAFDIVVNYHAVLDYEFGDTPAGKWLIENCADYGFILRYPRGKEEITGIEYEPWHFRYVGKDAAAYIMENELTLEEFLDDL